MCLTELLNRQVDDVYRATDGLMAMVDDADLDWRPASGDNWMTTGQLVKHLETACGFIARGFVTGDWGPVMAEMEEAGDGSPTVDAGSMPSTPSVAASREALAADRALTLSTIEQAGEERLANEQVTAPWNPTPRSLGYQVLECLLHLGAHRSQLFYYLKLMGKPVNTLHLWGMSG